MAVQNNVRPAELRRDTIVGAFIALILSFFGRQLADDRMTPVDSKRWNEELAEDLFSLSQEVVSREGEIEMQRFMGSGFDVGMAENYLAKGSLLFAQNINDGTAELLDEAVEKGESLESARQSVLAGNTAQDRAAQYGESKAQHLQSFSSMEAAKQRGGEYTKTWVGSGLPESRHKSISGETVEIFMPFSNGLQYPHDPSGPPNETVNCKCSLQVNGGPTLDMLGQGKASDRWRTQTRDRLGRWSDAVTPQGRVELPDLFHGTSKGSAERIRSEGFHVESGGVYGAGVYLSPSREGAREFGSTILRLRVDLRHPLDGPAAEVNDFIAPIRRRTGGDARKVTEELQSMGYDGVVLRGRSGSPTEVVAFDPEAVEIL